MKTLPKITFARGDPQEIDIEVVATVEQLLGRKLERADPLRIFLRGVELLILQQRLLIDETGKQNLLYYATGNNLDHLGNLVGCERLPATAAKTTLSICLSSARETTTVINIGTRVTADGEYFFALDENVIFAAGETVKTAKATCTVTGENGNGYAAGEIKRIVDVQPFLLSMTNTTTSEGGSDREDDEHYRIRIREAVEGFTCAGSEGSYAYLAKSTSALISDVAVVSPTPGIVNVYVLLNGGQLPGAEMIQAVQDKLSAKDVRPLTDLVNVYAAEQVYYDLNARYWISRDDVTMSREIQTAADNAVNEYVTWQAAKIGRDLNPSELIYRLKAAGVKRVEITSPVFTTIDNTSVAIAQNVTATFAGLEDE